MHPFIPRALTAAVLLCIKPPVIQAASLDQALDESQRLAEQAKASQTRIEKLDDATRKMLDDYRNALHQAEVLEAYNKQMTQLTNSQHQDLEDYQQQLDGLARTEESVAPMMEQMVQVLEAFVAADLPFLPQEREDRLALLKEMLPQADISLAEKYRRILEAYQIESDYGRTLEAWRGELDTAEGGVRTVEFLRLGRVMLYYQTLDAHETGWWNPKARQWQSLGDAARRPVTRAIAIARQQQAPTWVDLPMKTLAQEQQP